MDNRQASSSRRNQIHVAPCMQPLQDDRKLGVGYERGGRQGTDQCQRWQGSGGEEIAKTDSGRLVDQPPYAVKKTWRGRQDNRSAGFEAYGAHPYGDAYWNVRSARGRNNYIDYLQKLKTKAD